MKTKIFVKILLWPFLLIFASPEPRDKISYCYYHWWGSMNTQRNPLIMASFEESIYFYMMSMIFKMVRYINKLRFYAANLYKNFAALAQ